MSPGRWIGPPRCYRGTRPLPCFRGTYLGPGCIAVNPGESEPRLVGRLPGGRRRGRRVLLRRRWIPRAGPRTDPRQRLPRCPRREDREDDGEGVRARGFPGPCPRPLRRRLHDRRHRVLRLLRPSDRDLGSSGRPPDVVHGHASAGRGPGASLRGPPRTRGPAGPPLPRRAPSTPRLAGRDGGLGDRPGCVPAARMGPRALRGPGEPDRGPTCRVDVAGLLRLGRGRGALAPRPLLPPLDPIVLEGMLDCQADPIWAGADAVRFHRRAFRGRVFRRARRPRDVLDLVAGHIRREVGNVAEDPKDFLVPEADVVQERDDSDSSLVGPVAVFLNTGQEVVEACWETGDAHLPDVLGLERRLLRLEDAADLREVSLERREDVVVDRQREALLDVSLDRVPHDAERFLPAERHIPT